MLLEGTQGLEKDIGGIGDQSKNRDHTDHNIVKISWKHEEANCHSDFCEKKKKNS